MANFAIVETKRYVKNQEQNCVYLGTMQGDGWIYFNDDVWWRCSLNNNQVYTVQRFYIDKQIWINTNSATITNIKKLNSTSLQNLINGGGSIAPGGQGVENAIAYALAIAGDDSHGYDQANRWGPDYDCSSLVYEAFRVGGGFNLPVNSGYTGSMITDFTNIGFTWLPNIGNTSDECLRGDILLNITDHVEIYLGNNQNIGAHYNEFGGITGGQSGDQTGSEISITGYYSFPWDGILRYTA